jgi:hypothetical protein
MDHIPFFLDMENSTTRGRGSIESWMDKFSIPTRTLAAKDLAASGIRRDENGLHLSTELPPEKYVHPT